MQREKYENPEIEIVRFEQETDVLTNSYETPIYPAGDTDPSTRL